MFQSTIINIKATCIYSMTRYQTQIILCNNINMIIIVHVSKSFTKMQFKNTKTLHTLNLDLCESEPTDKKFCVQSRSVDKNFPKSVHITFRVAKVMCSMDLQASPVEWPNNCVKSLDVEGSIIFLKIVTHLMNSGLSPNVHPTLQIKLITQMQVLSVQCDVMTIIVHGSLKQQDRQVSYTSS